jgi:hypothetical protein
LQSIKAVVLTALQRASHPIVSFDFEELDAGLK